MRRALQYTGVHSLRMHRSSKRLSNGPPAPLWQHGKYEETEGLNIPGFEEGDIPFYVSTQNVCRMLRDGQEPAPCSLDAAVLPFCQWALRVAKEKASAAEAAQKAVSGAEKDMILTDTNIVENQHGKRRWEELLHAASFQYATLSMYRTTTVVPDTKSTYEKLHNAYSRCKELIELAILDYVRADVWYNNPLALPSKVHATPAGFGSISQDQLTVGDIFVGKRAKHDTYLAFFAQDGKAYVAPLRPGALKRLDCDPFESAIQMMALASGSFALDLTAPHVVAVQPSPCCHPYQFSAVFSTLPDI